MKTYVITVSEYFPQTHSRKGENTFFPDMILSALDRDDLLVERCFQKPPKKLHTIRGNYPLWKKRFDKIEKGEACLSIRKWTGKPYRSKQEEIVRLTKADGIGVQSLTMTFLGWFIDDQDSDYTSKDLAANDGLSQMDFSSWFKGEVSIDMEPMAIIHFTKFRY